MSSENVCPSCGAPLGFNPGSQCPSCGVALPTSSSSAQTIISHKSAFNNSAEVMDEIKNLIKDGDSEKAAEIAQTEFSLDTEAAHNVVEQTAVDIQYTQDNQTPTSTISEPDFGKPEVIDQPIFENVTKKNNNNRNMIIGGSIAAVVFLCCCCCIGVILIISQSPNLFK